MSCGIASNAMSSSFKEYVDREGIVWRFMSEESKDTYWKEFKVK